MSVKRLVILIVAAIVGIAAPARAWCEADCLAPAHVANTASSSHCQSTDEDSDTTSMSATILADCPTVESARPAALAKPVFAPAIAVWHYAPAAPAHLSTHPRHSGTQAPRHQSATPLRI